MQCEYHLTRNQEITGQSMHTTPLSNNTPDVKNKGNYDKLVRYVDIAIAILFS